MVENSNAAIRMNDDGSMPFAGVSKVQLNIARTASDFGSNRQKWNNSESGEQEISLLQLVN